MSTPRLLNTGLAPRLRVGFIAICSLLLIGLIEFEANAQIRCEAFSGPFAPSFAKPYTADGPDKFGRICSKDATGVFPAVARVIGFPAEITSNVTGWDMNWLTRKAVEHVLDPCAVHNLWAPIPGPRAFGALESAARVAPTAALAAEPQLVELARAGKGFVQLPTTEGTFVINYSGHTGIANTAKGVLLDPQPLYLWEGVLRESTLMQKTGIAAKLPSEISVPLNGGQRSFTCASGTVRNIQASGQVKFNTLIKPWRPSRVLSALKDNRLIWKTGPNAGKPVAVEFYAANGVDISATISKANIMEMSTMGLYAGIGIYAASDMTVENYNQALYELYLKSLFENPPTPSPILPELKFPEPREPVEPEF